MMNKVSNFASQNRPRCERSSPLGAAYLRGTCKTIVVWGKSGSGKTTTAVNLACALASKNHVVGVISSNMYYAELQTLLSCNIFDDKGLHKALSEQTSNINEQFIKSGVNSNVFVLSLPNQFDSLNNTEITTEQAERLLNQAAIYFDFLIIDGNAELQNAVTYLAMSNASAIITVYKPSISACFWHYGMERLREQLHIGDKIIPVLNANDNSCDMDAFISQTKLTFKYELPYIKTAAICGNSGSPIYYQTDRKARLYAKVMDKLADTLTRG